MRFLLYFCWMASIFAIDSQSFKKLNLVFAQGASEQELQLRDELLEHLLGNKTVLRDEVLVEDEYVERYFSYYANRFLIVFGTENRLFKKYQNQGIKTWGHGPFFVGAKLYDKSYFSYVGLHTNPYSMRMGYLLKQQVRLQQSLLITGSSIDELAKAVRAFKQGHLFWDGVGVTVKEGYFRKEGEVAITYKWNSSELRFVKVD